MYAIIPIFIPVLSTTVRKIPKNTPTPALRLSLNPFSPNMYSKRNAPTNGPMIIPKILEIIKPTIPPNIAPIMPHMEPPIALIPIALTMLSISVERMEITKRINRVGISIA